MEIGDKVTATVVGTLIEITKDSLGTKYELDMGSGRGQSWVRNPLSIEEVA